jgi:hypothetical protein
MVLEAGRTEEVAASDRDHNRAVELVERLLLQVIAHAGQPIGIFRLVKVVEKNFNYDTRAAYNIVKRVVKPLVAKCKRWHEPHKDWVVFRPDACGDCDYRIDCIIDADKGGL